MMHYLFQRLSVFLLFILSMLVGCDGGEQKLPEWVNPLVDARKALAAGEKAKAMEALSASIVMKPTVWALMERSKMHLEQGDAEAANADCVKALEIEPKSRDVKWLQSEIKKPEVKRFKGRNEFPPSYSK